jgi:hypothetical protein
VSTVRVLHPRLLRAARPAQVLLAADVALGLLTAQVILALYGDR